MRSNPFYFEIKDVMTQFVAAFNNIIISRHDKSKNVRSKVHVRYVYAPKQRVVHDLTNKARHLTLPVVAVNITGINRDSSRVFNKLEGAYYTGEERHRSSPKSDKSNKAVHMLQPVPINIQVSMSMMARYQTDIEQIVSNFVPYCDPYIVISWMMPEGFTYYDQEIRTEVEWSGDISMDYPDTLTGTDPYRLSADTTFTIKTWLFKQVETPQENIYKITTNISPVVDLPDMSLVLPMYDNVTERSYVEGLGPPLTAAPYITHVEDDGQTTNKVVLGYNLGETSSVYLSCNNINALSGERVQLFDKTGLNTLYPAFTGVSVDYDITSDNTIVIDDTIVPPGVMYDIVVVSAGGYDTAVNSPRHNQDVIS
jgi:hypothetical protein